MSAFVHGKDVWLKLWSSLAFESSRNSVREAALYALEIPFHGEGANANKDLWGWVVGLEAAERYAVAGRYLEGQQPSTLPADPPRSGLPQINKVAVYRLLESINYQCSEGDTHEKEPHAGKLKGLARVKEFLASSIIRGLPEYDKSAW
jgi:hypothetical protein